MIQTKSKKVVKRFGIALGILIALLFLGLLTQTPEGSLILAIGVWIFTLNHYEGKLREQEQKHKDEIHKLINDVKEWKG